ncbi:MAG: GNAT family N-acetyltransferase [Candidatus Competibacterales bacterium]
MRVLSGADLAPHIPDLARLRIEVFRDFPYLYHGSLAYEEKYLQTYLQSPRSMVVLVQDGERVVGASTGVPLADEDPAFQQPFISSSFDLAQVFYCGESVLHPDYRGRGIYRRFFQAREDHARRGGFGICAFCAVVRPDDHPRRPADYAPLDPIWRRFGYQRRPDLTTAFPWRDLDEDRESEKPMVFWLKALD